MSAALQSLLTPFQRQLADLQNRHAAGTLSKAELETQTAALERRLLDLLLYAPDLPARGARAPKASGRLLAGLALVIVLLAGAGYVYKTLPMLDAQMAASSEGEGEGQPNAAQIVAMVDKLAQRLQQEPNDGEGWAMLARAYSVMERNTEALDAFAHAIALRKDDATLLVDYADALGVQNQHSLSGEPMKLIQQALAIDPNHVKALALAGTDAFVRQDFAQAVRYWSQVEKIGPPESPLVQQVSTSLQEARKRAGLPTAPTPAATPAATPATMPPLAQAQSQAPTARAAPNGAASAKSVSGTVSLSAALLAGTSAQDTVFIFARSASGGRMPLAAQRVQVKDLPYRFTLDDSNSMSASTPLSSSAQVVLGARISKSGDAIAQPGDLSVQTGPVALGTQGIALEINAVRKP